MDEIEIAGLRITFQQAGEGPPLILLHGILGDSRIWRRQLADLSDEFTVVAWDAPVCGRSSDPPETFRLSQYADCLAGFVDALGLGRPHVLGLSLGGALADLPPDQWVPGWIPGLLTESAPADLVDEVVAIMSEFHPVGYRAMAHALAEADLRDVLPHIDVPTLLLYGDADRRSPLNVAEDLHAKISESRLVVLPGVGHLSNAEAAAQFNAEVRTFLRSRRREDDH